jgi:hypothetical protein
MECGFACWWLRDWDAGTLEGLEESQPQLDHKVDLLTWWVNNGAYSEAVRATMEETEAQRLMGVYRRQVRMCVCMWTGGRGLHWLL